MSETITTVPLKELLDQGERKIAEYISSGGHTDVGGPQGEIWDHFRVTISTKNGKCNERAIKEIRGLRKGLHLKQNQVSFENLIMIYDDLIDVTGVLNQNLIDFFQQKNIVNIVSNYFITKRSFVDTETKTSHREYEKLLNSKTDLAIIDILQEQRGDTLPKQNEKIKQYIKSGQEIVAELLTYDEKTEKKEDIIDHLKETIQEKNGGYNERALEKIYFIYRTDLGKKLSFEDLIIMYGELINLTGTIDKKLIKMFLEKSPTAKERNTEPFYEIYFNRKKGFIKDEVDLFEKTYQSLLNEKTGRYINI